VVKNQILQVSGGILFLALLGGCSSNNIKPTEQAEIKTATAVVPAYNKKTIIKNKLAKEKPVIIRKKTQSDISNNHQQVAQWEATQKKIAQQKVAEQKALKERAAQKWLAEQRTIKQKSTQKWFTQQREREQRIEKQRQKNLYLAQRKVVRKIPKRYYPPKRVVRKAPQRVYARAETAIHQYRSQPRIQPEIQPRMQQPQYRKASLTGDFANNPKAHRFIDKMVARHGFDRAYITGIISNARATSWMRKMAAKDENPVKRKKKHRSPNWTRYRSHFLTSRHINAGVAFYHKHRQALERAEHQFGVPKEYIMGILGVETIFGGNIGKNRAIDALTTMAFNNNRRGHYFESELESYLLVTRKARLNPLVPKASYAGALGLCQFMPSNIKKYGVDFDGDGGVNLWKADDAIASIARYFKEHGWRTGEMVAVPAQSRGSGYRALKVGYKYKYSPSRLAREGISASYQHNMRGSLRFIKLNTNRGDELWVGGKNFYVITRYNHSTHYAMAVHQLAQAIKQRIEPDSIPQRMINPRIVPTKKRPISVEEAMELLSASNDHKDAVQELPELISKESVS
jgi:membrane-bound lytic murein transglycosylase B